MENKYAEVSPRNFNPTWAPRLSDEARKAVNDAFDAMSAWRIEAAKNNEKNSEHVIEQLAGAGPAGSWPSASALGATNPMEFWMQWAEQWQKAWTDAMALWSKAGQPDYGVGSRRR